MWTAPNYLANRTLELLDSRLSPAYPQTTKGSLYAKHRANFKIPKGFFRGDPQRLGDDHKSVIDKVLNFYRKRDPQWLSRLTYMEKPWQDARVGLAPGERGNHIISRESIVEYYSSI